MVIAAMHYDFKTKLNRLDSKRYADLLVPEIDWKLNEAQEVFCKMVANPRFQKEIGFEIGQRTIDDIRTIVVDQKETDAQVAVAWDSNHFLVELPDDHWYFVNCNVYASKGSCRAKITDVSIVKHGEETENSFFNKSSFNWRRVSARFNKEGLIVETDSTFSIDKVGFQYLIPPIPMHNAQDFEGNTYTDFEGNELTGSVDCKLPISCHRNIVDLAVAITAGDLSLPNTAIKMKKVQIDY